MPATDAFSRFQATVISPLTSAASVTPHNTNELSYVTRALYVGGVGDVAVTMQDGGEVTFVGVPAGTTLPIRVKIVKATGTDATDIVALWQALVIVGSSVSTGGSWLISSFGRFVEYAIQVFDFILDSLTRGNLDNDTLG